MEKNKKIDKTKFTRVYYFISVLTLGDTFFEDYYRNSFGIFKTERSLTIHRDAICTCLHNIYAPLCKGLKMNDLKAHNDIGVFDIRIPNLHKYDVIYACIIKDIKNYSTDTILREIFFDKSEDEVKRYQNCIDFLKKKTVIIQITVK
jgi:hypothetical protein